MATVTPESARSTGRGVEILLLLLALVVGTGGWALSDLNINGTLSEGFWPMVATLAGIAAVGHVVLRLRAPWADPAILPVVIALNGIGVSMIHRLDLAEDTSSASRQLMWTVVGAVAAYLVLWFLRDHRLLRRFTYTSAVAGFVLLLLPMLPILGREVNGARIWIGVGPLSFQPGEIAKILLAIFMAGYLVVNRDNLALAGRRVLGLQLPQWRHMGPLLLAWGGSLVVLVFQRDLGTSLLFFGLFVATLYVATERVSWIVIGLGLFAAGVALAVTLFPHVAARFDVWLNAMDPEIYNREYGGSGQVVQGLFGLAAGGLTGTGWGQGFPSLVPYASSDFIIASLGEELGLVGLLGILMLFLVLVERGFRAGIGVRDGFGKLLAVGLSFVMAFQVFVIVGGITRLIPLTGLTTPFLSQGGSSMLSNWIVVALLLRISHATRAPAVTAPAPGASAAAAWADWEDEEDDAVPLYADAEGGADGDVHVMGGAVGGGATDDGAIGGDASTRSATTTTIRTQGSTPSRAAPTDSAGATAPAAPADLTAGTSDVQDLATDVPTGRHRVETTTEERGVNDR